MSDEKPQPPKPPGKPTTKTSTVPLKKETVRITLRAKPGGDTQAVPPPPAAGTPPAPRPPAPAPPAPPAPAAATQPLKPAPPAPPAPPAGAKTVPLTPAPGAATPPGAPVAQPTAKLQPAPAPGAAPAAAPGTRPLPKATVKLQPTQPVSSAPTGVIASAPLSTGRLSEQLDDDSEEAGVMPLAVVCLVLAFAAFAIELLSSQKVFKQELKTGDPSWAVPNPDYKHGGYERVKSATGEVDLKYNFPDTLPTQRLPIPTYEKFKDSKN